MPWRRRWVALASVAVGVALVAGAVALWRRREAAGLPGAASSRIKLVEDCNESHGANVIGGKSLALGHRGAKVSLAFVRAEPTSASDNLACAVTYQLSAEGHGSWSTGLNALDISAAKALTFQLRSEQLGVPTLRIELVDGFGRRAQAAVPGTGELKRWRQVTVPLRAFSGVNLNRLDRVVFHLHVSSQPLSGTLLFDDIAFVGPPDVFFRSLKDNFSRVAPQVIVHPDGLLGLHHRAFLSAIAKDTWAYFRDLVDTRHHLPANFVQQAPVPLLGDYASPTDIAMYLLSVVSAMDLEFLDAAAAKARIQATLRQLEGLPTWRHCFYNYYNTTNLQITSRYISTVDNAWLAASLIVVRQAFPELAPMASRLLTPMDFRVFYDEQNGQMHLGYDAEKQAFSPYHYGLLSTEARIISVIAIGKGDVPEKHWFRVYRTLPKEWTWQRQAPRGQYKTYRGHEVFQGAYTYAQGSRSVSFVPSWGGSLFEFLMPTLVIDERQVAPKGLGLNDQRAIDLHRAYAIEHHMPVWGLSPCATPRARYGGYSEFGVAALGAKGYKDDAIVTPHVTMLSLPLSPAAAEENLRTFLSRFPIYGPYGLYDAVDVRTKDVAYRYLALDQGMSLVALDNYLNDGAIQQRFQADPVFQRVAWLLQEEVFFDDAQESQDGEATLQPPIARMERHETPVPAPRVSRD